MEFFGDLERFASDLYPYRWPITIGLIAALALAGIAAWRLRWYEPLWRHRLVSSVAAAVALAVVLPVGWYTLSPLWERSHLEEASPLVEAAGQPSPSSTGVAPGTPATGASATPAFAPRVVARGEFEGADDFHFGRGDALLIETAPGRYTLRFENFSVRNGPDLFVYLSPEDRDVDGGINLGELKATDGAFNYEVPAGTDVERLTYAVVWCRSFAVEFATAPLAPV